MDGLCTLCTWLLMTLYDWIVEVTLAQTSAQRRLTIFGRQCIFPGPGLKIYTVYGKIYDFSVHEKEKILLMLFPCFGDRRFLSVLVPK